MAHHDMFRGQPPRAESPAPSSAKKTHTSPRSNIPTMRRDRRKQQEAAMATRRDPKAQARPASSSPKQPQGFIPQSDAMRWNRDGEPTYSPSHLNPGPVEDMPMGSTVTISGPARSPRNQPSPSFGERVRQFGISKTRPEPIDSRPAWNGASGRTALVQPVRDDPSAAPLQQNQRNVKRAARGRGAAYGPTSAATTNTHPHRSNPAASETPIGPRTTGQRVASPSNVQNHQQQKVQRSPIYDAHSAQARSMSPQADAALSYPSPPYSSSPVQLSPETIHPPQLATTTTTTPPSIATNPRASPIGMPDAEKAIKRKPPPSSASPTAHVPQPSTSSSVYSSQPAAVPRQAVQSNDDGWVQPPSRFSISTRATSTNTGSPRHSAEEDRPPMPESAPQTSMMDRSRPIRSDDDANSVHAEPIVISVKPFPRSVKKEDASRQGPAAPAAVRRVAGSMDETKSRPLSVLSTTKALPPAPPELMSAHDRVGNLNARLDGLAHRRNNINLSIKQMTELMPSDNLMASAEVLHKREIEKQKVEGLRQELADVQQEEYELGIKLHRAYKRLEREADFEPTGLWVRRVTG